MSVPPTATVVSTIRVGGVQPDRECAGERHLRQSDRDGAAEGCRDPGRGDQQRAGRAGHRKTVVVPATKTSEPFASAAADHGRARGGHAALERDVGGEQLAADRDGRADRLDAQVRSRGQIADGGAAGVDRDADGRGEREARDRRRDAGREDAGDAERR